MKSWTITCGLMLVFPAGAAARQEALSRELTALQGNWNIVSVNGQSVSDQGVALSVAFRVWARRGRPASDSGCCVNSRAAGERRPL